MIVVSVNNLADTRRAIYLSAKAVGPDTAVVLHDRRGKRLQAGKTAGEINEFGAAEVSLPPPHTHTPTRGLWLLYSPPHPVRRSHWTHSHYHAPPTHSSIARHTVPSWMLDGLYDVRVLYCIPCPLTCPLTRPLF